MNDANEHGLMDIVRQRLTGFHRDEDGQSIVYLVLIMFLLACFTFMVINSGALLHDKIQAQSASDAAVISGTTWVVRAMNLNSMMNILMAMVLAQQIYMKAVFWTALTAVVLSPVIEAFWLGVCVTTGTCNPALEVVFDTIELWGVLFETEEHEDFLKDIMENLTTVEQGVDVGFRAASWGESVRISMMNGAEFGFMYPFTIPEEQGELTDLCDCVLQGEQGGYNEVQYSLIGSITTAMSEIGGFSYAGDMRNMAADLVQNFLGLGGPLWGEMQIPYHAFWAQKAPYHFTNVMFVLAVWARYAVMCGGGFGPANMNYEIGAAWWCFFCDDNEISIPNPFYYLGAAFAFLDSGNPNIKPMVLPDDWQSQSIYRGFAYKGEEDIQARFLPEVFDNGWGETVGMVTMAQAQVYNPHEEGGMFAPHWRTHLVPVTFGADDTGDVMGGAGSTAPPGDVGIDPGAIGGAIGGIPGLAGLSDLMAH